VASSSQFNEQQGDVARAQDSEVHTCGNRSRAWHRRLWRFEREQRQCRGEFVGGQYRHKLAGDVEHTRDAGRPVVERREQRSVDRADPSGALKFTKSSLTVKAGTVTISFTNRSPLAHNLTVQQGTNGPVLGATPTFMGATKTLKLTLKAGTYTFYCSVPGHRAAGMQGTLTVQ